MSRPSHDHSIRISASILFVLVVLTLMSSAMFAATTRNTGAQPPPNAQELGTICKFTTGPKANTLQDYSPMHAPLDTRCTDGAGSAGVIVAAVRKQPAKPISETPVNPQTGTICSFTTGPKTGTTQDYAPMEAPLNMPCTDGMGSSGVIVATPQKSETGSICKFTAGPKTGTTQDYSPMHAPLDTACDDGAGSSGVIIAKPAVLKTGTVCKFSAGPKAGTTHDYAPMHAPVGTACDDGAGSSGAIIDTPVMGSMCSFTAGPKTGKTHDYAPMHAPVGTACDDGAGSSGTIIVAPAVGSICNYTEGPKAGKTHDYAPMHAPLGTACDDGAGSSGVIVASSLVTGAAAGGAAAGGASAAIPAAATVPAATASAGGTSSGVASAPSSGSAVEQASATGQSNGGKAGRGSVCKLTAGPMAGTTYDFAPMQAFIGSPCNYGSQNTGVVIAGAANAPPKPMSPRVAKTPATGSSVCHFTSGPMRAATADISPVRAPLGAPCSDGHGSDGYIVEH